MNRAGSPANTQPKFERRPEEASLGLGSSGIPGTASLHGGELARGWAASASSASRDEDPARACQKANRCGLF